MQHPILHQRFRILSINGFALVLRLACLSNPAMQSARNFSVHIVQNRLIFSAIALIPHFYVNPLIRGGRLSQTILQYQGEFWSIRSR